LYFFFQAEDGIRDLTVTGVQTCALPIWSPWSCPRRGREGALHARARRKQVGCTAHAGTAQRRGGCLRERPCPCRSRLPPAHRLQIGRASCRERVSVSGLEGYV